MNRPHITRSVTRAACIGVLLTVVGAFVAVALAHSEPDPPPPAPPAPPSPKTSATRIYPPRWSWLHWWEANREKYLVSASQDDALQSPDPAQLAALREEAARELVKAIESQGRDIVAAEAALALGKMRHEPALPLLKKLATTGDRDVVRRAALLGIGLLASDAAEKDLAQFSAPKLDQRVAGRAAIGLLPDLDAATLRALRSAVTNSVRGSDRPGPRPINRNAPNSNDQRDRSVDDIAMSTVTCWTLRHHAKDDNLEYFRSLLALSESPWVASEALLGLGGTKNHAAQRLLEEALFGDAAGDIRAFEKLQEMLEGKLRFAGGSVAPTPGRAAASDYGAYEKAYNDYLKEHQRFYNDNRARRPRPPAAGKYAKPDAVHLEFGHEEIGMGWLRSSAAIALGQLDAPRAGEALLRFISQDPAKDEYLLPPMGLAIMSLSAYPSEASRDRLIGLLGKTDDKGKLVMEVTKDSPLRGFAALALGLYARPYDTDQGPADRPRVDWAIMTLAERLEDEREEEEVRTACAVALGLTQRTSVLPVLHRISAKIEQRNRRVDFPVYGFLLLGRSLAGDRNIIEPAAKFLLDREDDASASGTLARRAAVLSLGVTRSSTAVPVLTRAWHLSYHVNREVILALRLVGGANAAGPIMERLRNPKNDHERAYMAQALGELLAHEQPTAMIRFTAGSNYTVRNDHLLPLQAMANAFLFEYLIASFGEAW